MKPAKVADSGYRYYSNEEIRVLQHIAALKELGFTLASIKEMSSTGKDAQEQRWRDYLDFELAAVVEERKRLDGGAVSMLRIVFVLLLLAYIIGFEIVWQWK
nr:MerR family transcriptional regulator [Paenibacillus plantiphilus]